MQVPDAPLTLTKIEAATRQVECAVEALVRGHFDVAITLAGAAEGMIKGETPTSLFAYHRDSPKRDEEGITEKELVSPLNKERDWLKHACEPDSMQFQLHRCLHGCSLCHQAWGRTLDSPHCCVLALVERIRRNQHQIKGRRDRSRRRRAIGSE